MFSFNKSLVLSLCVLGAAAMLLTEAHAQDLQAVNDASALNNSSDAADESSTPQYLIIMVDRSSSMDTLNPPETQRAVIKYEIDSASLANQPIGVLVVCYGGDGVQIFGDNGKPSFAYESVLNQLLANWPEANGGTPMDAAMEKVLEIVRDLPDDARTTILQITDGKPDSMQLRPEVFQPIRDLMAKNREVVLKKAEGFPANVQQELIRQFEQPLLDSRTIEWQTMYERQVPLEYQRTLDLATALKKEKPRIVTVDFANDPQLAEIHLAAGGIPEDLIVTSPNDILSKLNDRKITALPGLVQMPVILEEANAELLERATPVPLEPIGEKAQVDIELQPSMPDFFLNGTLKAEYAGRTYDFNPEAGVQETSIALDGDGAPSLLTLKLSDLRPDEAVTLYWETLNGNMTAPRWKIHTLMRMKSQLKADFRPSFMPIEVKAPFDIASSKGVAFSFGLQNEDATEIVKVADVEAIFRSDRGLGQPVRMSMKPDAKHPDRVISDAIKLAAGKYDVQLTIRFPSGIAIDMTLKGHVNVSLRNEAITVELPFGTEDETLISGQRSHLDFGSLGDLQLTATRLIYLRSKELDYPITVKLDGRLSTTGDVVPTAQWLSFKPNVVTLQPGKAVPVKVTVTLPKDAENGIADGPVDGQFTATLADSDVSLPIYRFKPVANVSDDDPVNRLSFVLRRPHVLISLPWALREWSHKNSEIYVRIDIRPEYYRDVQLYLRHTGSDSREITVVPAKMMHDGHGSAIPELRLVPADGESLTRVIAKNTWECFKFRIESDANCQSRKAEGLIEIYGPGVVTNSVKVRVSSRSPMLAATIFSVVAVFAVLAVVFLIRHLIPYRHERKLTSGNEHDATPDKPLHRFMSVSQVGKSSIAAIPEIDLEITNASSGYRRKVPAETPIPLNPEEIEKRPIILNIPGESPGIARISEVHIEDGAEPVVHVVIEEGGVFDTMAKWRRGRVNIYAFGFSMLCLLAFSLQTHFMVHALQWIRDALRGN